MIFSLHISTIFNNLSEYWINWNIYQLKSYTFEIQYPINFNCMFNSSQKLPELFMLLYYFSVSTTNFYENKLC